MDLQSGYLQLPLREEDRQKTAFGKFFLFVVANGPSTFKSTMDFVLGGLRWNSCLVYLDDIIVYDPTFSPHLERLNLVLSCLSNTRLKLKTSKCKFAMTALNVLGHVVSRKYIREVIAPDPEKLRSMSEFRSCNERKTQQDKIKRVQNFLGLFSYYQKHTPGFSKMALPLILLTKKDQPFVWGEDQQNSFD